MVPSMTAAPPPTNSSPVGAVAQSDQPSHSPSSQPQRSSSSVMARNVLILAACYNLLWGGWVVLRPLDLFVWTGAPAPLYPGIWQCVGMIVGVYGIGYAIAANDPYRHWPIV